MNTHANSGVRISAPRKLASLSQTPAEGFILAIKRALESLSRRHTAHGMSCCSGVIGVIAPGKAWERGMRCNDYNAETFLRNPAGPNPARQSGPAAGSKSCVTVGRPTLRSVDRPTESLDSEPRKISRREPSLLTQAGAVSARRRAWRVGPTGVQDPGEPSRGFPRNLGGLPSPACPSIGTGVAEPEAPGSPGVRLEPGRAKGKA